MVRESLFRGESISNNSLFGRGINPLSTIKLIFPLRVPSWKQISKECFDTNYSFSTKDAQ